MEGDRTYTGYGQLYLGFPNLGAMADMTRRESRGTEKDSQAQYVSRRIDAIGKTIESSDERSMYAKRA
jgi:hypothetical protein